MASMNNVPKEILESMRECLDRRLKLSIKRLVNYETKKEKLENRVLAFSTYRLFVLTAKAPTKVEAHFHYLEIKSLESKRPNQLVISTNGKTFTFVSVEGSNDSDEFTNMVTHIGTSLKTIFPTLPLERLIKKIDILPADRLRVMYDLLRAIESREPGPCGGFTLMYASMCDFHGLMYRDEVAWDVDTIYLSQDSKELCLRDFDHLKERDLVPIVSALVNNTWFTGLIASNIKLGTDVCTEILRVMKKNAVIESLLLSGTGISTDFVKRLSNMLLAGTNLHILDISNNQSIDDTGGEYLMGTLSTRGRKCTLLDISGTKITSKGLNRIAEVMSKHPHVFSGLQTLKMASLLPSKGEDLQGLYAFMASPNMISHLDLSATEVEIDRLMPALQRGCSQNLTVLKLSRVAYSKKKECVVQTSFKQFFSSAYTLKHVELANVKLPPDAIKDLFLGLDSNRNIKDVHVDLSGCEISMEGAKNLTECLCSGRNITRLDIGGIIKSPGTGLSDRDLIHILENIGRNNMIKALSLGQIFNSVKPKNLKAVLEKLVEILQADNSVLDTLSLADSKLRDNINLIINALGSNASVTELDISGNQMGDLGARMLCKALQINNKLKTILWDRNNTSCQGFEDIALALEKNYTLRNMPVPVFDASAALRTESESVRTQQALQTIERLIQRNHSPQKYSSDQGYRLQQGFLLSSTQQMLDRLVVQSQDTINALSLDGLQHYGSDVNTAQTIIADADNTKTLLPRLHDIAIQSEMSSSPVAVKLREISKELTAALETQMQSIVHEMMEATVKQCGGVMKNQDFVKMVQSGCTEKSALPKDFTSNILDGVNTEIFNKLSELNLAIAAHISDTVLDQVIDKLSHSHRTLTNYLNEKRKERRATTSDSPQTRKIQLDVPLSTESPKTPQRKSMLARKIRPQSVIDRDMVQKALDAAKNQQAVSMTPNSSKQGQGSRSPLSYDPPPAPHDIGGINSKQLKHKKEPKVQKTKPRKNKISIPTTPSIKLTSAKGIDIDPDPEYDNATDLRKCSHRYGHRDGLDEEPSLTPVPKLTHALPSPVAVDLDSIGDLPTGDRLTHVTKDRARLKKNVRPTAGRQSAMTGSTSSENVKVDEGIEGFFSTPSVVPQSPVKNGPSSSPSPSSKSTPESIKKTFGGLFNMKKGKKNKDEKKMSSKQTSISSKKKRISEVKEEEEVDSTAKAETASTGSSSASDSSSLSGSVNLAKQAGGSTKVLPSHKPVDSEITKSSEHVAQDKPKTPTSSLDRKAKTADHAKAIVAEIQRKNTPTSSLERNAKLTDGSSEAETDSSKGKPDNGSGKTNDIKENGSVPESETTKETTKAPMKVPMRLLSVDKHEKKTADDSKEEVVKEHKKDDENNKEQIQNVVKKSDEKDEKEDAAKESYDKHKTEEVAKEIEKSVEESSGSESSNEKSDQSSESAESSSEEEAETVPDSKHDEKIEKSESPKTESVSKAELEEKKPDKDAVIAEPEAPKPVTVRKPPGAMGIGFDPSVLSQLKSTQEKRLSKVPKQIPEPDRTSNKSPTKEKPPPFGGFQLRPVSKEKSPVFSKKEETKSAVDKELNVKPGAISAPFEKKNLKSEERAKPETVPRPSGITAVGKPPPPMKPKPTPTPRRSIPSSDGTETAWYRHSYDEQPSSKTSDVPSQTQTSANTDSGVVYDSATLKKSVKEKMSIFHAEDKQFKQGRPLSITVKGELPKIEAKRNSLPHNVGMDTVKMAAETDQHAEPVDNQHKKTQAGDIQNADSSNSMTDSGIGIDAESPGRTAGSPTTSQRPRSMLGVLKSRPELASPHTLGTTPEGAEEKPAKKEETKTESDDDIVMV
ncbi:F-actin-uncapping protein LRRC16A-like [Dreissena polymorpha]|uniref:F-actin-uncapping protein LRRC16A-like n=1 Tax=Dreissena polymorpha TaxID=45954 RepID=UPI0022651410|nr:F-actin-uncapping protein LRRC16A-like [Dreissena polymorpha]